MPHNRVPLLGLVMLALVASAFIATQLSSGQAPQTSKPPLKMRVLRDKVHVKNSPNESEIANFKKQLQENERQLEDSIPKHVPLKIKIKKEKEAGFKDLKNERWAREFELEVTNTGKKPIYFLYLYVVTDIKAAKGFRIVFPLTYGRSELGDIKTKPEPTDVPIQPGETVSLKIHPGQLDAWDVARQKEQRPFPKRLQVTFQILSFGDATGYFGTDATPIPNTVPEEELQACLPSSKTDAFGWQNAPPGSPLFKQLAFNLPAALGPVTFLRREDSDVLAFNLFPIQTCCGGSNCAILKPWTGNVCVNCPPQNRPSITTCNDPQKTCGTTVSDYLECFLTKTGDSYECQTIQVLPCGSSPPSPAPAPSPSPSPSPTPTPCPLALPSECPGGVPRDPCTNPDPPPIPGGNPSSNPDGCPFGYQVSGTCCVPMVCPQPTPTPPACGENETSLFYGPPDCQWSDCFTPFPDPGATPTPQYAQACVDYYWVWYVSYDGGVTWQPTGQVEYAGCFHLD
ncbi:MAG TPA: hypothetical protein VN843_26605 [Anaerolineales bacterium]|nr:hypothetical protein [Anaerolineales bacterium]